MHSTLAVQLPDDIDKIMSVSPVVVAFGFSKSGTIGSIGQQPDLIYR